VIRFLSRLWAFVKRDFFQELSYRLSFFFQFYGVFFSVTLFYFIAKIFSGNTSQFLERYDSDYFAFVVVGVGLLGFMTSGMSVYAGSIRQGQMLGTLEAMLVTPTSISVIVTSSAVWTYLRSGLMVIVYLAVGMAFGLDLSRANVPTAILVIALAVVAFSALGILSASFILAFKRGDPVTALFGGLSGLLGGTFFPVEVLPSWVQPLAELIPLKHALEAVRGALLLGHGPVTLSRPLLMLALFAAGLMPLAVGAFRLAVRKAKRDGSLAQY
jgi:ABC-2 type transport system permease protein